MDFETARSRFRKNPAHEMQGSAFYGRRLPRCLVVLLIASALGTSTLSSARAQLLWSFESGLEGWTAADVSLTQSSFGATDGSMAMLMDNLTSGFNNDVGKTGNFFGSTPGFENAFTLLSMAAAEIANGGTPNLEFDFTFDLANVTSDEFLQLGIFINSDGGFTQYGTGDFIGGDTNSTFPTTVGGQAAIDGMTITPTAVPNQYRAVVPLGPTLQLAPGSTFFDIGFKSNGAWLGTVDMAIDNIQLSGLPEFTSETIFSWETADDPNTAGVNEQFEGWTVGFEAGHSHAISSFSFSEGSSNLEIDRQGLQNPAGAFSWGSQFVLDADTNPDPNVTVIDPQIQMEVDDLIVDINEASFAAFDVRFDDSFPNSPTFTSFGIHFSDDQETFFDGFSTTFEGIQTIGSTATVMIPLSSMVDDTLGQSLADVGLSETSTFLRIGIGTNTDGAGIYQIDNFRLLTEVPGPNADFDGDGVVTGEDFLIYQENVGLGGQTDNSNGDANGDGVVGIQDLAVWEDQYGTSPLVAAPEPGCGLLALLGCLVLVAHRCAV